MTTCYQCYQPVKKIEMTSGLHPECFCCWFGLSTPSPFQDVAARSSEEQPKEKDWHQVTTSFFHGKFRKYSARINEHSYILKVKQQELPELPVTEYLCNQLASLLGLEVPDFYMIRFENELDSFVSRNFMENRPGCDLVHIYRYLERPEDYDCEHLLKIIEEEVGRYESIVRFIELCLFDSLIGNHDRHGRNLGIIRGATGSTLAPFYDNPCYLALEIPELLGAHHEPRGAIATAKTREPLMSDYVQEWVRLGFKNEVSHFAESIDLPQISLTIDSSFLSERRKTAMLNLCDRRYKELCDAI